MDPMLECFISESRENLETAGQCFLALEKSPENEDLLNDLFRAMHTMKGSSGLFDIPAFTKVVHAAEDVLDVVRVGDLLLTSSHIDLFLDMMDQVNMWLDDLENQGELSAGADNIGAEISAHLRSLLNQHSSDDTDIDSGSSDNDLSSVQSNEDKKVILPEWIRLIPEQERLILVKNNLPIQNDIIAIDYLPEEQCFFSGDDPLHTVLNLPKLTWFNIYNKAPWPELIDIDPYICNLAFSMICDADYNEITTYTRYITEQINIIKIPPMQLVFPIGELGDNEPFVSFINEAPDVIKDRNWKILKGLILPLIEISGAELIQTSALKWMLIILQQKSPAIELISALFDTVVSGEFNYPTSFVNEDIIDANIEVSTPVKEKINSACASLTDIQLNAISQALLTQEKILAMPCADELLFGRIASVGQVLTHIIQKSGNSIDVLEQAILLSQEQNSPTPLLEYLNNLDIVGQGQVPKSDTDKLTVKPGEKQSTTSETTLNIKQEVKLSTSEKTNADVSSSVEPISTISKVIKVDQHRIDMLMDLVGELVVAKNALPFIANKAENEYGMRALAKEISSQYAVINRLSEELQSTMMQIRMVPVSTVFQRFPRLVRDLSRKLNKKINLILEGEETEADKTVVESLADPLIHLVRNSLDHGLETSQERIDANKPEEGTIILRAIPHDDQVVIEVIDDGRGIDPKVIKRKAYEKGIIDEQRLDSISDQEALQLILAAGFSTAEEISDLSGRGVGMDVVHSVVNQAGGSVIVQSKQGEGSTIRLSLPLSMAVSRVMMIELADQTYGISMDHIVETVRIAKNSIKCIKHNEAVVLRDRLIPLFNLRTLLAIEEIPQRPEEVAVLVMTIGGEEIGLIIDDFQQGIDIIQKPLEGVMANYSYYSGAALLGDGRVLLVLNIKELLLCR